MNCTQCYWWTQLGCENTNWKSGQLTDPNVPVCDGLSFKIIDIKVARMQQFPTHEHAQRVRAHAAVESNVLSRWKHNKYSEFYFVNTNQSVRRTFVTHLEKRWSKA